MSKHISKETAPQSLFECNDYREYVRLRIRTLPKGGRGEYRNIARHLKMHTTLVSQVFGGKKRLTSEQAIGLTEYFGLNVLETVFFMNLVETDRAGTETLRSFHLKQQEELRNNAQQVANRIPKGKTLSDSDRMTFYSSWQYSAIRLLTSIPGFQTIDSIAGRLKLQKIRVREVLGFLVDAGLCLEQEGRFILGPKNTHIEAQSPLASRHHLNWRTRGLIQLESLLPEELAFTAPISLSKKDFPRVRKVLLDAIESVGKIVSDSDAEDLACLKIDWAWHR